MKKLIEDLHYTYEEATGAISFNKDDSVYLDEKAAFAQCGVDLDQIKTINEYDKLRMVYRDILLEAFQQKWRKVKPKNIEEKYEKALLLFDLDEASRLKTIIQQKRKLNLKVVK